MILLHTHTFSFSWASALDLLVDACLDALKALPFLFFAFLIIELLEHHAGEKLSRFFARSGKAGPAVGALLGCVPQCGFSVMSANLYDALKSALMLFGVREANATDLLKLAKECRFPYVSPFGLKLKQESIQQVGQGERAIGYNWNFAKALSVALAYCVGGLDVYGLSYSLAREVVDMFVEVAKEQDCAVVFEGEIFTHFLVIESHMAHTTYLVDL